MLTSDLAEIVGVFIDKYKADALDSLSADDLRNISLILWGYLKLVKSGFMTKADSPDESKGDYNNLKGVLALLTSTQEARICEAKIGLLDECTHELDGIDKQIDQLAVLLDIKFKKDPHHVNLCVSNLKKCTQELRAKLLDEINDFDAFTALIRANVECSYNISQLMTQLIKYSASNDLDEYNNLFQNSLAFCAKRLLFWREIQSTNNQCMSYISASELIELLS